MIIKGYRTSHEVPPRRSPPQKQTGLQLENINGDSKFATCQFRSADSIKKTIKRCSCRGGDYEEQGFFCHKKQIFKITEEFCASCEEYKSK